MILKDFFLNIRPEVGRKLPEKELSEKLLAISESSTSWPNQQQEVEVSWHIVNQGLIEILRDCCRHSKWEPCVKMNVSCLIVIDCCLNVNDIFWL